MADELTSTGIDSAEIVRTEILDYYHKKAIVPILERLKRLEDYLYNSYKDYGDIMTAGDDTLTTSDGLTLNAWNYFGGSE